MSAFAYTATRAKAMNKCYVYIKSEDASVTDWTGDSGTNYTLSGAGVEIGVVQDGPSMESAPGDKVKIAAGSSIMISENGTVSINILDLSAANYTSLKQLINIPVRVTFYNPDAVAGSTTTPVYYYIEHLYLDMAPKVVGGQIPMITLTGEVTGDPGTIFNVSA